MQLRGSHLVSFAILAGIGGWMFTGQLIRGGQVNPNAETIAEREAKRTTDTFRVRVKKLMPEERIERLSVRGRTEAEAMISVRAETGGTVEKRVVEKGQRVKQGDLLCVLDKGTRQSTLNQAEARLKQTENEYKANLKLKKRGFATTTKLHSLKSALDAAHAAVANARQDMKRTEILATTTGQIQEPMAQAGDNLAPGGICVTVVDTDPMLFSGQVPERQISNLKPGMPAAVTLVSGETIDGNIRYISTIADAKTRTFKIEIVLPNPGNTLRDGLTATASINLLPAKAYKVDSSWLVLADNGQIGVRAVSNSNKALFVPVKIIAQDEIGMWVEGLQAGTNVITLGQNFVTAGEPVEPVTAEQLKTMEDAATERAKARSETKS